jgi:SAM-dependent methyltransferase
MRHMIPEKPSTRSVTAKPASSEYEQLGVGYASNRRADPRICHQIAAALTGCRSVVNVGAGTGSYEPKSCVVAVEPSTRMIRQRTLESCPCIQSVAEALPFRDKAFEGALAVLTIHHWVDLKAGLEELRRVVRKRVVILTWDPETAGNFWLARDYLPELVAIDARRFPSMAFLGEVFESIEVQIVPIPHDCSDGIMGAFWNRPERYLNAEVRRSMSGFARLERTVVQAALERLAGDLRSGLWHERNRKLLDLDVCDLGYRLVIGDIE